MLKHQYQDALRFTGLLLAGFMTVVLVGASFGLNGEGAGVSVVTVLSVCYVVGTVPITTVMFAILSKASSLSFWRRAAAAFGVGLVVPALFLWSLGP